MTLSELIKTVSESAPEDWNTIGCWGANSGPSYHDKFEFHQRYNSADNVLVHDSHGETASLKSNVSVTIAWGLRALESINEDWAAKFPDKRAYSDLLDVFFNGALVFRTRYVVVDGGRCYLPFPKDRNNLSVPLQYCKLISLLDSIKGNGSEFKQNFAMAGFSISEEAWH